MTRAASETRSGPDWGRYRKLLRANRELKARLREAEGVIAAIRNGEVDALVVDAADGDRLLSIKVGDYPYRRLVESMSEGIGILSRDGSILYANRKLADMLATPLESLVGVSLHHFVISHDMDAYYRFLRGASKRLQEGRMNLWPRTGSPIPSYLSVAPMKLQVEPALSLVAKDLRQVPRPGAVARFSVSGIHEALGAAAAAPKD
jgi:PAS domain S-box-containing protein